ncbi:MAG: hypothetical protein JWQ53_45, partial [Klenkia sp.]|nr:hypothetical protein [Klenkia sp.]
MGDTGPVTTSAQRPTPAATSAATDSPAQARRSWPWLVAQSGLLLLLGLTAVGWAGAGARVLLAGVGALGVVRGVAALRAGRA